MAEGAPDERNPTTGEPETGTAASTPAGGLPEPDQAWKALSLVNDWVRHAETKVGATLAATGVVGVMLYNLVKAQTAPGITLSVVAVLCAIGVVAAAICATLALLPRRTIERSRQSADKAATSTTEPAEPPEDAVSLLFFSSIAKAYAADGPSYVEVLRSLTLDKDQLTRQIANQVHANAIVAHRKFIWADRAIKALMISLATLGLVAVIVGSRG